MIGSAAGARASIGSGSTRAAGAPAAGRHAYSGSAPDEVRDLRRTAAGGARRRSRHDYIDTGPPRGRGYLDDGLRRSRGRARVAEMCGCCRGRMSDREVNTGGGLGVPQGSDDRPLDLDGGRRSSPSSSTPGRPSAPSPGFLVKACAINLSRSSRSKSATDAVRGLDVAGTAMGSGSSIGRR